MAKRMLFIFNPKAGRAQIKTKLIDILNIFTRAGYEVTTYPTQKSGDAIRATKEKRNGFELVVCSGGDGTLDEVVSGMMQSDKKVPIGYIPAGSTNDFAKSLHIPSNMLNSAKIAVTGKNYACDVGVFNDKNFIYIAAFGIFTEVSYETDQQMKNVLGHIAYLLEGMKRLSSIKSYRMKVVHDGVVIEDDFIFGMITNSTSVGGFKRITGKNVVMDDGVFEVTLIKLPKNPMELNQIMGALMDRNIDTEGMLCFKTDKLTIESKEIVAWTLDGEYGGSLRRVEILNLKQAIEIKIP